MNWTSPTRSTVVGSSHSRRPPVYSLGSVQGSVASFRPSSRVSQLALRSPMRAPWAMEWTSAYQRSCLVALRDAGRRNRAVSLLRPAVNSARPSLVAA